MKPKSTAQIPTPSDFLRQKLRLGTNGRLLRIRLGTPRCRLRGMVQSWGVGKRTPRVEKARSHALAPTSPRLDRMVPNPRTELPRTPNKQRRDHPLLRHIFWSGFPGQEPPCWNVCCQDTHPSQQVVRPLGNNRPTTSFARPAHSNRCPIWCRTAPARKPNNCGACLTGPQKAWCRRPPRLRASFTNSP